MNALSSSFRLIAIASAAGAALFAYANSSLSASVPTDLIVAGTAAAAAAASMIRDYARRRNSLTPLAPILRPTDVAPAASRVRPYGSAVSKRRHRMVA